MQKNEHFFDSDEQFLKPGEKIDDLQSFDALEFCRALVGEGM